MKKTNFGIKGFVLIALMASALVAPLKAKADLWVAENQWSEEWEAKYQDWLRENAGATMFATETKMDGSPNPYYGIRVDCADLVYSLRVLFSYENKLPYAIHNPVSLKGPLITNSIKRFDKYPEGMKRIKSFLTWIYDLVSTHGLPEDTYSIPFDRVSPGVIILTSRKNHHSWTIKNISRAGNPDLVYNSTVGRTSGFEVQERQSWPNPAWIFEAEVDPEDETKNIPIYKPGSYAGFRFWRPLDQLTVPEEAVTGYSEEQHIVGISKWKAAAIGKLAVTKETVDQIVMRLLKDACADFQQRVTAVAEVEFLKPAWKEQQEQSLPDEGDEVVAPNQCLDADNFDKYSTPSRDRRFVDGLMLARVYFQKGLKEQGAKAFTAENLAVYKTIFPYITKSARDEAALDKTEKSADNFCSLEVSKELGKLSLAELKRRAFAGRMSANPNDAATGRFGYPKTDKDIAYTTCKDQAYGLAPSVYSLRAIEKSALAELSQ